MTRPGRTFVYASAAGFWLLLMGFLVFASWSSRRLAHQAPMADGIVVLTGGSERRIDAGLKLLRQGLGSRLLISGVNPRSRPDEFLGGTATAYGREMCCVDLGYVAQTTIGNASEARDWAERYRFRRLIVVTSSYHMPRSLNEMGLAMPDVELIAHPVVPRMLRDGAWWLKPSAARMLFAEYLKLLPSYARWAALRLLRPLEDIAYGRPTGDRTRAAQL